MKEKCDVKKSCSFCVSNMHFITMIMPFLKNKVENEATITTFLEKNYKNNVELMLSRLTMESENKKKISNLKWNETIDEIEETIINNVKSNKENIIIVNGRIEYIETINEKLQNIVQNNLKENVKIWVMNFYDAMEINKNITDILRKHDTVFNTSGEHEINDMFDNMSTEIKIN